MVDFFWTWVWPFLIVAIESVVLLTVLLIVIAYVLYADRKIWAAVQIRRGPNVVGPWGLFQSFADLIKFALKEPIIPAGANKGVFLLAPLVTCVLALAAWAAATSALTSPSEAPRSQPLLPLARAKARLRWVILSKLMLRAHWPKLPAQLGR